LAVKVPQEVTTRLKAENWASLLATHPNQELVQLFITGNTRGFHIGHQNLSNQQSATWGCALQHPDTVSQYLADEIAHNRVADPF